MSNPKNLKDGYFQALRPGTGVAKTRVAVDLEGATISVPGGIEVQLSHLDPDHDSVRIGDGTNQLAVNADGSINVNAEVSDDTTTVILNVPVALAGTEISQALPANTKGFVLRSRGNSRLQIAFSSGQSGTNYFTVPNGASYEDKNFYSSQTLYFQSSKAGETVEIIAYT